MINYTKAFTFNLLLGFMDPRRANMMSLTTIHQDMRMFIVLKVGSISPLDYYNTIIASKSLNFGFNNYFIAKDLNHAPLVRKPLLAYKYKSLMDSCLKANNTNSNFFKGMLEYFHCQNQFLGLHHIRLAAKGGHKEGRKEGTSVMRKGQRSSTNGLIRKVLQLWKIAGLTSKSHWNISILP